MMKVKLEVLTLQIDKIPKIFISYSWSSDALVLELANRLVSHGVDVVLDKWGFEKREMINMNLWKGVLMIRVLQKYS
mgnify:CR=1 FL=1